MKILIVLLLVVTSVSAATLVHIKYPYFYFDDGDKWMRCVPGQGKKDEPIKCTGMHKETKKLTPYVCKGATKEEGFLKDCVVEGAI